jgi:hypothetical protein
MKQAEIPRRTVAEIAATLADIDAAGYELGSAFSITVAARILGCSVALLQQYDRRGLFRLPRVADRRLISRRRLLEIAEYRAGLKPGPSPGRPRKVPLIARIPLLRREPNRAP